jgi:hypothetical protein
MEGDGGGCRKQPAETGDLYPQTVPVALASRRQFTLAGMLSFVLAVGVYSSMIASVRPLIGSDYDRQPTMWPVFTTILTAWCVLWWLYRKWRLPQALRVHYTGPAIVMVLLIMASPFAILEIASSSSPHDSGLMRLLDVLEVAAGVVLYGCGVSTAVSLPVATVMLLYLMLRPAPSEETRRVT